MEKLLPKSTGSNIVTLNFPHGIDINSLISRARRYSSASLRLSPSNKVILLKLESAKERPHGNKSVFFFVSDKAKLKESCIFARSSSLSTLDTHLSRET